MLDMASSHRILPDHEFLDLLGAGGGLDGGVFGITFTGLTGFTFNPSFIPRCSVCPCFILSVIGYLPFFDWIQKFNPAYFGSSDQMRGDSLACLELTINDPACPLQQKVPRSRLRRPDKRVSANATPVLELQHYQALTIQNKSVHPVGVRCTRRKSASPRQLIKRIGARRESQRQPEQHGKSDG